MKRTILSIALALCVGGVFAQVKNFEKLAKIKDVKCVHIDKNMINLAAQIGGSLDLGEDISFNFGQGDILSQLDDALILTSEKMASSQKLVKSARKLLKGKRWNTLINVNGDEGEKVEIRQTKKGKLNTTALLVSEDEEATLVVMSGALDIAKLLEEQGMNVEHND